MKPHIAIIDHKWLSKLKLIGKKNQFLVSVATARAQQPSLSPDYHIIQLRYRTFPSLQKVLLDSAVLDLTIINFLHIAFTFIFCYTILKQILGIPWLPSG